VNDPILQPLFNTAHPLIQDALDCVLGLFGKLSRRRGA